MEINPEVYLEDNYLVVDFETTNTEHGTALAAQNNLLLACWRVVNAEGRRDYAEWGSEFEQSELLRDIELARFVVAHNAKFELQWLRRCGIDLRKVVSFDTMIGEKIIAGNRKVGLSLAATAERRGLGQKDSTASTLIKAGVCPSAIPKDMLEQYCAQDVALTESVFLEQRKELSALDLLPVAFSRNLVTPVLADIEFNGMNLDATRVVETYEDYSGRYEALRAEFERVTGGINFKSAKQMREYLYTKLGFAEVQDYRGNEVKTGAGASKVDKATISALQASTPEQKEFKKLAIDLAKLKVPVQNLTKMMKVVADSPNDPRIFAQFNQTVTDTHRLSSSARNKGFQFHNLDRAFKPLFKARKHGFFVVEADAPQLEFRFAAFLGRDKQAIEDITNGVDIHQNTADVFKCKRQDAKAKTFAPLYGATSGDAKTIKYRDFFRARYAGIFETQTRWTMNVARDKFLVTPWGLRFYWPDTEIQRSGYVKNTTSIFNYPIQSGATAEIIPMTLRLVWDAIEELGDDCMLVNTIHDSIVAEVKESAIPRYKEILIDAFTRGAGELFEQLYGIKIDVPLGVGIKASEFWSEGKEEKYETFDKSIISA